MSGFALLSIPGADYDPEECGAGSPAHAEIVAAVDDAVALVEANAAHAWDGPDDPSRSWDLELEGGIEISVQEYASVLHFHFSIAEGEPAVYRTVLVVRDERLGRGWLRTATPERTRTVVLGLLREWRHVCAEGHVVDRSVPDDRLPEGLVASRREAVARFSALCSASAMAEWIGFDAEDLMWRMRHPTPRSPAALVAVAPDMDEATFDEATMSRVLAGVAQATMASRDARDPISLTVSAYEWPEGFMEAADPMQTLRLAREIRDGREPTILSV